MTREEEIIQASKEFSQNTFSIRPELVEDSFIEGAKWADKHPYKTEEEKVGMGELGEMWKKEALIDKACEYLKSLTYQEYVGGPFERLLDDYEINEFRKAMEQ